MGLWNLATSKIEHYAQYPFCQYGPPVDLDLAKFAARFQRRRGLGFRIPNWLTLLWKDGKSGEEFLCTINPRGKVSMCTIPFPPRANEPQAENRIVECYNGLDAQ